MAKTKDRIRKREGRNGVSYQVRVEYPPDPTTGRRVQKTETYRTKKEAEARVRDWRTEIARGVAVDATKMNVAEYLRYWLETSVRHAARRSTYVSYARNVEKHLIPEVGHIGVQKLQPNQVQALYTKKLGGGRADGRQGGLSPRTVRYLHTILHRALQQAVKWDMIGRNVCDATDPPRVMQRPVMAWTVAEARQFLEVATTDRWSAIWITALTTGMRRGELLGMRWRDIDFERGVLNVQQCLVAVAGERYFEPPKTAKGRRVVALSSETVAALREHRARQNVRRLALGPAWRDGDLVFTVDNGGPIWPDDVSHRFAALVEKAGVPCIRLHGTRHTHATLLLRKGVHLKIVSERLGHSGIQMTADVYSHVTPDMQRDAARAIDTALFGT
jgi:integrase